MPPRHRLTGAGPHGTIGRHDSIAPASPAVRLLAVLAGPRKHGIPDGRGRGGLAALHAHRQRARPRAGRPRAVRADDPADAGGRTGRRPLRSPARHQRVRGRQGGGRRDIGHRHDRGLAEQGEPPRRRGDPRRGASVREPRHDCPGAGRGDPPAHRPGHGVGHLGRPDRADRRARPRRIPLRVRLRRRLLHLRGPLRALRRARDRDPERAPVRRLREREGVCRPPALPVEEPPEEKLAGPRIEPVEPPSRDSQ